ncbi:MAG: Lrp/AsnC family transcriptional regulator [Sedimenticola sp.]|nr:Lrp/AsnC family transcriptional regulator [Sedimenticola sp.]MCW8881245.1 Lrp/AsnC family transcriptional regulator [Sedimenticola sp.]MCW8920184.1 Lrp/AsnC family transcriptional regulator [Sedimenticola sp.]MCW8947776.1 Lrp/AsnC family transcriptional regulator [Sedimenticola sp.]MCW8951059.1 Lrp/AsnC family transcriptional regulator [Sedimenticola sp.]
MATPAIIIEQALKETRQPHRARDKITLNDLEKRLLNEYQKGLPLTPTPFADIAKALGTSEALVLKILDRLQELGVVSRVGPVFKPKRVGASTLAAMAIPEDKLEDVADQISAYAEVNHNYEREDSYNLWFVVTAPNQQRLETVLREMEQQTGYPILYLPLEKQFHIDLGFPLWC